MISNFLKIFCQILLFILLFCQSTLIYLSLIYGGIPVSNLLIQKYVPKDLNLSSQEILFFLPYHIKLIEPEFTKKADTLLQLDSPEIFVSWQPSLKELNFNHWKIHSYSGQVNTKLYPSSFDLNQLSLIFSGSRIQHVKLLLRSEDKIVYLNYSAKKYLAHYGNTLDYNELIKPPELLPPSIEQNSSLYSIINAFHASKNSYIECFVERTEVESHTLSTVLSSESINLFSNKLQSLQIQSQHHSDSTQDVIFLEAAGFSNPQIAIQSDSIRGKLKLNNQMQIDSIKIDANSSRLRNVALDAISVEVLPINNDFFTINGTLFHKNHTLSILTDYQINAPINTFLMKAHLDLNELQNDYFPQIEGLEIQSPNAIFADAEIILDNKVNLVAAEGHLQGEPIQINSTPLQYLRSDFRLINKRLKTKNTFKINQRTSYINTDLNIESGEYIFTLNGSTFSSDFNSIMPKWWQNTFQDFSYTNNTKCFHDFAIYGSTKSPIPSFFLGSVQTENLSYKGVPIKYGDLLVEGKNHCTEITLKDIRTELGKSEGVIKITKKPDGFKKPESVRTKLKSELTIETAKKLFGNDIQEILSNFQSYHTHKINIESTFFNPYYTQHKNKSYYNLSIERANPILFFNRPFDQFSAEIYGRNAEHHIRSARAEFAGGQLNFEADILETSSNDPQLRINLSLTNCDYGQTIRDTFQNEFTNASFNESPPLALDLSIKSKGSLLDFAKHNGHGNLAMNGPGLGKIHLLGPFSKALAELNLSIGVFSLTHLESDFLIQNERINVQNLEINGEQSHVFGQGQILIPDQSINFKMEVDLFKNRNLSFPRLGSLGKIFDPMTKIFNFTVTGTLKDQKWRSAFDPRNLFK